MAEDAPSKIVYLFGAGATHAELQNLDVELVKNGRGLLVSHVSKRVLDKARKNRAFQSGMGAISSTSGSLNIELLISLIENSKVYRWESKTRLLKKLVEEDIENILSKSKPNRFYLHKALLELHRHQVAKAKEELIGLISLNYDNVLDTAFEESFSRPPRYCFSLEPDADATEVPPLLKLHGSFNWKGIRIRGQKRNIEIIPLGSTKNYIHPPYGCIWNHALEMLIACDKLRVIGCSLSQNDFHLVDLLFKVYLEKEKGSSFEVEIIASEKDGETIRDNYGFFTGLKTLTTIRSDYDLPEPEAHSETKDNLVADPRPPNPFKAWLGYKSRKMLGEEQVRRTKYLKRVAREGF